MTGTEILNGVWSHAPEVGVIIGAAAATYLAKLKGFVHFGRSVSDRRSCPSKVIGAVSELCGAHTGMEKAIKSLNTMAVENKTQLQKIDEKVDSMCVDLSNIAGYLQGKNGYHQ